MVTDPAARISARRPAWSGRLTGTLAAHIPDTRRPAALVAIKAFHSLAFFAIAALIVVVAWDGLRSRPRRRTVAALTVALAESAVYGSNNLVCPLSPLAEELGATSGSVTDIYLPDALSRRVPVVFGTLLLVGCVLNLRAWRARDPAA